MANAHLTIHWNEISSNRRNAMKSSAKKKKLDLSHLFVAVDLTDYLGTIHVLRRHIFWTFSDPPTHYVSTNTVLNINKNVHILNPSTFLLT